MADFEKTQTPKGAQNRPPPLPDKPGPKKPGALSNLKAFVTIRRIRLEAWVRRRPIAAAVVGLAVAVAVAAGVYVGMEGLPDIGPFSPSTVAEASKNVRSHPNDASARRDLGHSQWDAKKRHRALAAYGRALAMDRGVADDRMIANLVASFGGRDQHVAETLIWKYNLVAARPALETLVSSRHHSVRWGAVRTLDKLEKGTKKNWETAYILDLDSSDCDVRRTAVEKLGGIGTRRALSALREAKDKDEKTGGWFRSRCLGDRVNEAEQRILARK